MYYLEEPIKLWPVVAEVYAGGAGADSAAGPDGSDGSDGSGLAVAAAAAAAAAAAGQKGDEKTFIQIKLVDEYGKPVPNAKYQITTPDGKVVKGSLDGAGAARLDGLTPGVCHVSFPTLHVLGAQ